MDAYTASASWKIDAWVMSALQALNPSNHLHASHSPWGRKGGTPIERDDTAPAFDMHLNFTILCDERRWLATFNMMGRT